MDGNLMTYTMSDQIFFERFHLARSEHAFLELRAAVSGSPCGIFDRLHIVFGLANLWFDSSLNC